MLYIDSHAVALLADSCLCLHCYNVLIAIYKIIKLTSISKGYYDYKAIDLLGK